ncbi:MAG TPA: glycosyltransferase family 2 protein [Candidatus Kapabacteria bacterium]|nr:glycosyltransferase family 2 protein [Candidatus Kapabacteria bacterium]HPO62872.1 glycosyltransferase family 2 protein [Candidatus Kapabacteria bacterium]
MYLFSIIIISFNTCKITLQCIKSVYKTCPNEQFEIIVVDNDSKDDTVFQIKNTFPEVKVIQNKKNLGYAAAANIGAKAANSEFIIVSNSDIIFLPNSIQLLIQYLKQNPKVGIVGPQQLFPNGKPQYSYNDIPGIKRSLIELFFINSLKPVINNIKLKLKICQNPKLVGYLDGGVNVIRKTAFQSINGYDERFFFYSEEVDLCYRLKKSCWKVVFFPQSKVIHLRGASSNNNDNLINNYNALANSKIKFCKKYHSNFYVSFYIFLQILYNFSNEKIWKFLNLIFWKRDFSNRIYYFKSTKKIFFKSIGKNNGA